MLYNIAYLNYDLPLYTPYTDMYTLNINLTYTSHMKLLSLLSTSWKKMWCEHDWQYNILEYWRKYPPMYSREVIDRECKKCFKSKKL